jgi:hypothetical protein
MSSGSVLPPDVRQQLEAQAAKRRAAAGQAAPAGIGGSARENTEAARAHAVAMAGGVAPAEKEDELGVEKKKEPELKNCPHCHVELDDEWNFCAKCGEDLQRQDYAKKLGIELSDKDVQDYIFKGFVTKEMKILGDHTLVVKSSQPSDADTIDEWMMNGKWRKNKDGSAKSISDFYFRQMQSLSVSAMSTLKMDGELTGDDFDVRFQWLNSRGSALVDMITEKVVFFNRALTSYLKDRNNILGS